MDQYLIEGASFLRLLKEYDTHGSLYIGFDFDGTVHDYHNTGESHEMVRQLLRDLKEIGCKIVCWTAYKEHDYVENFCKENNIPCDGINCDAIPLNYTSRKPFFSVLIDDRAGMAQVYKELKSIVNIVKARKNDNGSNNNESTST